MILLETGYIEELRNEKTIEAETRLIFRSLAQIKRSLEHFASKVGMDISGLGRQLVFQLYDEGHVKNIAEFLQT